MPFLRGRLRFSKIGRQTLLLSTVPIVFLILLLGLALLLQSKNAEITAESQRSAQVLNDSQLAVGLLTDVDRSLGEFLQTHNERALAPYEAARVRLPQIEHDLSVLLQDEPAQRTRAAHLTAYFSEALNILGQFVRDIRTRDTRAERVLTASPRVRSLRSNLTNLVTSLNNAERIATIDQLSRIHKQIQIFTAGLVALCILAIGVTLMLSIRFGMGITRRIVRLAENAGRLAKGEKPQPIGGDDEITQLDRVYQEMTKRIQRERDKASALQRALLPQELPNLPGLRLDAAYTPAAGGADVGGDWYDVFQISERRVGISIGDVAGHGLRAAAIMGNTRQAIRTVAYFNDNPASVMTQVNQVLCRTEGGVLVTAFFATFDLVDGSLRYCLAGHPPPMTIRAGGTLEMLAGEGFVLGVEPRAEFKDFSAKIDIGTALVLFTDGIVEAGRDYFQGLAALEQAIKAEYWNASHNIAEAIQNRIFAQNPPHDDSALLFVGVTTLGPSALEPERVAWTLDARSERSARRVKRALLWHLGEIAGNGADLSLSELIVTEILGNVARHTPGPARVTLERREDAATVRVVDEGPRFEPPATRDVVDPLAESGRGIFLLRAMARSFTVEWTGAGNCASAILPLDLKSDATLGMRPALA